MTKKCFTIKILISFSLNQRKIDLLDSWSLKRGSIHMKFSMTGQDKSDLLIPGAA
jgi:hypothetical protein